jgi:AraC family transcriptional activator of pyochelin receptor
MHAAKDVNTLRPAEFVEVSPEMTTLIGHRPAPDAPLPPDALAITFDWGTPGVPARVSIASAFTGLRAGPAAQRLTLVVQRSAFARIGGGRADLAGERAFHLPPTLAAIAVALAGPGRSGEGLKVYRLAKSIELLCETIRLENAAELVPLEGDGLLSRADTERVLDARRLIDQCWAERLTLERIARACGLNRAKLTSSFREVFKCTVAEALAERRLAEARRMLLTTDLPVGSIGYRSGYQNNAAFSRAFSRRFGVPPTGFRAVAVAA